MSASTLTEMLNHSISEVLKGVGTSIPAHVLDFDTETQLAKLQIDIQFIDVNGNSFELAPVVNIPVHFSGGDFVLEHQIDEGNEGLIIVSQRCIDAWKEQGGVATQSVIRKLDMQDGLFIPGFRSKPNAITGFENNGIRLRNKAGDQYVWLKNDNSIDIVVSGNINLNGVIIDSSGNVTIPTSLNLNSKEIAEHTHSQGNDSAGNTQVNTSPNI